MYVDGYFARPTIDTAVYPFYHSSGSWNRQLWLYKDKRVDQILDDGPQDQRRGQAQGAFRRVPDDRRRDRAEHHRLSAAHVNGVSKKVEGFHSTPMQWLELKDVSLKR